MTPSRLEPTTFKLVKCKYVIRNTGNGRKNEENTDSYEKLRRGLDHVNPVIRLPIEHGISRGPIPGMTPTQALTVIQTMADHSQKWHDGTSSRNISSSSNTDGLAAIVNKLDNLGRDMKKLKENVHAIQVGRQICEGPHLDKDVLSTRKSNQWKRSSTVNLGAPLLSTEVMDPSFV
ncbi:hypothetical protein Tco_0819883 [Tanacetum coccineum]|uniref:Uncharacterized protein n=1 Tax=Tanacetum coccineum TaxID=301880 RepID=A0ABQ5A9K4_9ASTR